MALDQIIGAALSTAGGVIVGVFLFWWRTRAEDNEELRQWYAKTERLAERVINATRLRIGAHESLESAQYVRSTCAGVHTSLASHLAEAPVGVQSEVVEESEKLVEACQRVKDIDGPVMGQQAIPEPRIIEKAREATDQAETVQREAKEARRKVG